MREVTASDCNPDRVTPTVSGTSLVPDARARPRCTRTDERIAIPKEGRRTEAWSSSCSGCSRQFGAVRALTDVSFDCRAGEVHAARRGERLGEVDPPRDREWVRGPRSGHGPDRGPTPPPGFAGAGQEAGLGHGVPGHVADPGPARQEQPLPRGATRPAAAVLAEEAVGAARPAPSSTSTSSCSRTRPAGFLTLAERQLFEVAKALVTDPKVLLLDEPTTALGPDEVEALHRTVAACRDRGVGVVYVSHRLPEVLEIADRITVLRDGRNQGTFDARATTEAGAGRADRRPPVRGGVPAARARRSARPARCSWSTVSRGSRSGPSASRWRAGRSSASRAPRATASPSSSTAWRAGSRRRAGRVDLRRQGADADLDPRGGAGRDHAAAGRSQARGVDAGARGQGQRHDPDAAPVQRARLPPPARGARDGRGTGRAARDPHAVARAARRVPLRGQPAEGRGRANVPAGSRRSSSPTSRRRASTSVPASTSTRRCAPGPTPGRRCSSSRATPSSSPGCATGCW